MKRGILSVIVCLIVSGCASYSDPKGSDFRPIKNISETEGVYRNSTISGYLSSVIWGGDVLNKTPLAGHHAIDLIEVAPTPSSVTVNAIANGCVVYTQSYTVGRDIKISNGRIIVRRKLEHLLSRGSGDVLVGPSFEEIALGLDEDNQGMYRSSTFAAGLVFLMLPVAFSETKEEMHFARVATRAGGFPNCRTPANSRD